jgi:hypothetical protein
MWFAPVAEYDRARIGFLAFLLLRIPFLGAVMKTRMGQKSLLWLVVAALSMAMAPAAFAQQNQNLDKHGRHIEKRLAKYCTGSFVQIDFRNGSQSLGSLGSLSASSFQMTDAENNQQETYSYDDVADVRKGRQYIGEGSEPSHRPRFLLPVLISAAAAAATVAIVETVR